MKCSLLIPPLPLRLGQNSCVSLHKYLPLYLFSFGKTGILLPCSSIEKLRSQICMPQEHEMKSKFNNKDAQDCISLLKC